MAYYDDYDYLLGPRNAKTGQPPKKKPAPTRAANTAVPDHQSNMEDMIQEQGASPDAAYAQAPSGQFAPLSLLGALNSPAGAAGLADAAQPPAPQAPDTATSLSQGTLAALTNPQAQAQAPASPDNWQPHRRTTLGGIGDVLLSLLLPGFHPFGSHVQDQNMQEAMQDFTTDPMKSVRRLAMLHGHEGDAVNLYEKIVDDKRADAGVARQNRALDMRTEDYVYQMAASMMNSADASNWGPMREMAIKRATDRGMDRQQIEGIIPQEYDPDTVKWIVAGAIKPKDKAKIDQAATNEQGRNDRFTTGQANMDKRQQVSQTGMDRRQRVAQAGMNDRHNHPVARPMAPKADNHVGVVNVMTKYGVMTTSKDRTQALLKRGNQYFLYKNGGLNPDGTVNWIPQGEAHPK